MKLLRLILIWILCLLLQACFSKPISGGAEVDSDKLKVKLYQSETQADPATSLPVEFILESSLELTEQSLQVQNIKSVGSSTGVKFNISPIGSNKFKLSVYQASQGVVKLTTENMNTKTGLTLVSDETQDNSVTLNLPTPNANLVSSFAKKFADPDLRIIYKLTEENKIIFGVNKKVYVTDGSLSGTKLLIPGNNSNFNGNNKTISKMNGQYFIYIQPSEGGFRNALWMTDGTPEGSTLVVDEAANGDFLTENMTNQEIPIGIIDNEHIFLILRSVNNYFEAISYNVVSKSIVARLPMGTYYGHQAMGVGSGYGLLTEQKGTSTYETYIVDKDLNKTKVVSASQSNSEIGALQNRFFKLSDGRMIFPARTVSTGKINVYITDGTVAGTDVYGGLALNTHLSALTGLYRPDSGYIVKTSDGKIMTSQGDKIYELDEGTDSFTLIANLSAYSGSIQFYQVSDNYIYIFKRITTNTKVISIRKSDKSVSLLSDITTAGATRYCRIGGYLGGDELYVTLEAFSSGVASYDVAKITGNSFSILSSEEQDTTPITFKVPSTQEAIAFKYNSKNYLIGSDAFDRGSLYSDEGSYFEKIDTGDHPVELKTFGAVTMNNNFFATGSDDISIGELYSFTNSSGALNKIGQFGDIDFGVRHSKIYKVNGKSIVSIDDNVIGSEFYEIDSSNQLNLIKDTFSGTAGVGTDCGALTTKMLCFDPAGENISSTDGTSLGTNLFLSNMFLGDMYDWYSEESIYFYTNNNYFFLAPVVSGGGGPTTPRKTDGTSALSAIANSSWGTDYYADIIAGDGGKFLIGDYWDGPIVTDGDDTTTEDLYTVTDSYVWEYGFSGGFWYLGLDDSSYNYELYVSDGTVSGTSQLRDFDSSGSDDILLMGPTLNNKFLILANDVVSGTGRDIWISDGTSSGTNLLKDLNGTTDIESAVVLRSQLSTYAVVSISETSASIDGIYITDGTNGNLTKVIDGVYEDRSFNINTLADKAYVYVKSSSDPTKCELYTIDGSTGSANLLVSLDVNDDKCYMTGITTTNYFYFLAYSTAYGIELWKTDGTSSGTSIYLDSITGTQSLFDMYPEFYIDYNNLYFWGDSPSFGETLWSTPIVD